MILLYLIVIAFLILFPTETAETALRAMRIWGANIVPILFPYMLFSRLLCKSLQTLSLPTAPATAILGLLGGSPTGASMIAARADRLSPRSVYPLMALSGTVSPMFILGTMQSWIRDSSLCRMLLLCHWVSALLCAWIVWTVNRRHRDRAAVRLQSVSDTASSPITQSIDAILHVGGCIICYSVLAGILGKITAPLPFLEPYIHAVMEISGGIHAICESNLTIHAKGILLSASLGFGGLSILSQNHAMLKPLGVTMHQLLLFAVLRAAISALLMLPGMYLPSFI